MSDDYLIDDGQDLRAVLAALAEMRETATRTPAATIDRLKPPPQTASSVDDPFEMTYNCRRIRDDVIGEVRLFGEPAWDILLTLASASEPLQLIDVCEASRVPMSEAIRYVLELERRKMIVRHTFYNPKRARLGLSPIVRRRMEIYVERVRRLTSGLG